MNRVFVGLATLAIMVLPVRGQDSTMHPSPAPEKTGSTLSRGVSLESRYPRYKVRKGDVLDLDFALSPEFNQTITIQPDGFVTLKGIGTVHVEDETLPELTETVRSAYSTVLHDPLLVVSLKDFDKPSFIASGEVGHPGKYEIRTDVTLSEALAIAGGASDRARISKVVLYRRTPEGTFEGKVYNLKRLMAAHDLSEDPLVQPGDLLYVPRNISSRLHALLPTTSMGAFYGPGGVY